MSKKKEKTQKVQTQKERDEEYLKNHYNDGLYNDDDLSVASSDHYDINSDGDDIKEEGEESDNQEEDFISLPSEVDNRFRQQRRLEERMQAKRKREDESEDENESYENLVCYPWMDTMNSSRIKEPVTASRLLQRELECFIQYIEPTKPETKLREYLVHRIQRAVEERWPEARTSVFGSFSTDLYLPNGDIDLVIIFPVRINPSLRAVAGVLERHEICRDPQIISGASVPVIKFEDVMTKIKVDIILNSESGLQSAQKIRYLLEEYPGVRPIAMVVKHLLATRGLNEVFSGGLGGYAIVCLVVSFMQMHPKIASGKIDPLRNLGVLLLDFFQLYGINFNINDVGIAVNRNGFYYDKSHVFSRNGKVVFSIEDPQDSSNDIGSKSFQSMSVIKNFKNAYLSMSRKAFALEAELKKNHYKHLDKETADSHKKASILGTCLYISPEFMKQRDLMNAVYSEKRWEGQEAAEDFSFEE